VGIIAFFFYKLDLKSHEEALAKLTADDKAPLEASAAASMESMAERWSNPEDEKKGE
jgi:hypothetical protein